MRPQPATADKFFRSVDTVEALIRARRSAREALPFEETVPESMQHVSLFADRYMEELLTGAPRRFSDADARLIAQWVQTLDIYAAVKAVESLLNSHADLVLLKIARDRGWDPHFDHLAVRCGSSAARGAERIANLLKTDHGYVSAPVKDEQRYQFADGWSAYPLYKMLENGQLLRLFIDQSDAGHPEQIIQHWHRVYGYTAHHLAIRLTRLTDGMRRAVRLREVMDALARDGVDVRAPTGFYTAGLLEQVFAHPERVADVPVELRESVAHFSPRLADAVSNGKLLEIVSRLEMGADHAERFFALYGLEYRHQNPLHSTPAYLYFLPAQAAHVIRTSVEAS